MFQAADSMAPALVYWGPAIGRVESLSELIDQPIPGGGLDGGERLTWTPEAGQGFTGHPALLAHRAGRELITTLVPGVIEQQDGRLRFVLDDPRAEIEVALVLTLDAATGVLASRTEIRNLSAAPLHLDWLAAGAMPSPHAELLTFGGRWAREFATSRQRLADGLLVRENRTGRTSHHAPPFLVLGEAGFSEHLGEVFGLHLGWSGDHRIFAERLRDGRIQAQAGELFRPGEMILAEGETYASPTLYLARSGRGLNGLSDRFHPFVRRTILAGRLEGRPRPVHYNTWEAVYFDHDAEGLKDLAARAAAIGVERFVLDDGWFAGRGDDRAGLGDWRPDPVKYPQGLAPLIAHVRGLGMQFGLWVEPEMVNENSDLFRAHPDWILGAPGRAQPLGRGQYVLDLSRSEVAEALFVQLDRLLSEYAIGYLKWDMNRDLTHPLSGGRAATHAQTLAVYALIDRLRAAHPQVEIESCASGGGRADFEILRRTDRIWTSDCNDPIERASIQRAFSIFFPPEVMGAHVGPRASHTTARTASMAMRAFTALAGHFGIEADLRALTEAEAAELAEVIALYKSERAWMHGARLIRLDHSDPGCLAWMLASEDQALVVAAQVDTPLTAVLAPLRLTGWEGRGPWRVEPLATGGRTSRRTQRGTPLLRHGGQASIDARLLVHAGLPLPILHAGQIAAWMLSAGAGA